MDRQRFDAHAAVIESVADGLCERLELIRESPTSILDLGCRTGYQLEALAERFPAAFLVGLDPAPSASALSAPARLRLPASFPRWLRRPVAERRRPVLAADPHRLPFAAESFDLVVSNLLLPWCRQPYEVFREVARVLAPGGAFFFTSAGPDTLREYRAAWAEIDAHAHVFGLVDMHDLGDAMLAAGLAEPVLDRDGLVVEYPGIDALQTELRALGAGNVASGRRHGLMAPSVRTLLKASSEVGTRFSVTFELVHGHAWKGQTGRQSRGAGGEVRVDLDELRRSLKH